MNIKVFRDPLYAYFFIRSILEKRICFLGMRNNPGRILGFKEGNKNKIIDFHDQVGIYACTLIKIYLYRSNWR